MTSTARVALVTGAARGIGQTIALALAQPDLRLYINDVTPPESAADTIREVEAKGARVSFLQFNVADLAQVEQAVDGIIKESGRLDILVNNAGITRDKLIVRMKEEDWDAVLAVNLKGAFNCLRAVSQAHGQAALRPHHQHQFGGGGHGERRPGQLRGLQGRPDRAYQVGGPGAGLPQYHGQRGGSRLHPDGDDRDLAGEGQGT